MPVNPELDVCYVAFTGKAATVLQSKGCPNATTAHKLLYRANQRPDGSYVFAPKKSIPYKIVVVDEISMLPLKMWELLMSHGVYVLACGDPGQLPPIDKSTDNHVLDTPHIFLDEIMRQAQDSEIIRLSMWVREGKPLSDYKGTNEQVQLFTQNELVDGMYSWADQILCATNAKRNEINNYVRAQKGYGIEPEIGDKIISLHNHWEFMSDDLTWALTNGSIGTIDCYQNNSVYVPKYIYQGPITYMTTDIRLEDGALFLDVPIDYKMLKTGVSTLDAKQSYLLKKNKKLRIEVPYDFAYAYAITTWKAQGSEWDKVLGIEEQFPYDEDTHRRFLYTMITRAKDKLVIIKK